MSMTPVDKIAISLPVQASALLTKIAAGMFDNIAKPGASLSLSEEVFEAWKLIREHAHLYATHGLIPLEIEQETRLVDALFLAHKIFHSYQQDVPLPSVCDCEMAEMQRHVARYVFAQGLKSL